MPSRPAVVTGTLRPGPPFVIGVRSAGGATAVTAARTLATSAFGAIRQNLWACSFQSATSPAERADPVNSACWATRFLRKVSCGPSGLALDTSSGFTLAGRDSSGSYTYA